MKRFHTRAGRSLQAGAAQESTGIRNSGFFFLGVLVSEVGDGGTLLLYLQQNFTSWIKFLMNYKTISIPPHHPHPPSPPNFPKSNLAVSSCYLGTLQCPLLHQHSLFARVPILCNYSI